MSRYNLIDEPWIQVISDDRGTTKKVSLKELFNQAHNFRALGGESRTQNFAILRLLLAIIQTVFSRMNIDGKPYSMIVLDERLKDHQDVDRDEFGDYAEELMATWSGLWDLKEFPNIITEYLDMWKDRFYLLDEQFPFYQVTEKDAAKSDPYNPLGKKYINITEGGEITGKILNRLISESGNKTSLFSPKYEKNNNKEILTEDEMARWLITFQGYTGLSDKIMFGEEKYKVSKGWLFDIGGIYLEGNNLFETLMLNMVLIHPKEEFQFKRQKPCWEYTGEENIKTILASGDVDNLSELYTRWSRAVYLDPEKNFDQPSGMNVIKLPEIIHQDQFLELMTLWRYNDAGENKDKYTPRKHRPDQALWRAFGLVVVPNSLEKNHRRPGIIDWANFLNEQVDKLDFSISSVSMQDDGNATSWMPVDEVCDALNLDEMIIFDAEKHGWNPRINELIDDTKQAVEKSFRTFVAGLKEIRNSSSADFVSNQVEELYYKLDGPFRNWLIQVDPKGSKNDQVKQWKDEAKKIIISHAEDLILNGNPRDYKGVLQDSKMMNVVTVFNKLVYFVNRIL